MRLYAGRQHMALRRSARCSAAAVSPPPRNLQRPRIPRFNQMSQRWVAECARHRAATYRSAPEPFLQRCTAINVCSDAHKRLRCWCLQVSADEPTAAVHAQSCSQCSSTCPGTDAAVAPGAAAGAAMTGASHQNIPLRCGIVESCTCPGFGAAAAHRCCCAVRGRASCPHPLLQGPAGSQSHSGSKLAHVSKWNARWSRRRTACHRLMHTPQPAHLWPAARLRQAAAVVHQHLLQGGTLGLARRRRPPPLRQHAAPTRLLMSARSESAPHAVPQRQDSAADLRLSCHTIPTLDL